MPKPTASFPAATKNAVPSPARPVPEDRGAFGIGSALAEISRLDDGEERRRRFDQLAEQLLRDNTSLAALAKAAQVDVAELADGLRLALLRAWARRVPAAAAQYARGMPEEDRPEMFADIFGVWGNKAPLEALQWLTAYPEGEEREWATGQLFRAWSLNDSQAAAQAALRLPDSPARNLALGEVAGAWAGREPLEALNWVAAASSSKAIPEETGNLLRQQIVSVWAERAPAEAANWAFTQVKTGQSPEVLQAALAAWSETDPASAAAFLAGFPSGEWRKTAAFNLGLIWGRNDASGAQAWVQAAGDPERDTVASGLIQALTETSPPEAMAVALGLQEKNAREAAAGRIAKSWRAAAPAAYREWWESAAVEAALKARLPRP